MVTHTDALVAICGMGAYQDARLKTNVANRNSLSLRVCILIIKKTQLYTCTKVLVTPLESTFVLHVTVRVIFVSRTVHVL